MLITTFHLNDSRDLHKIGLAFCTGERDNTLTGRVLFDLSMQGARLVRDYLSLTSGPAGSYPFESSWNQHVGEEKAFYSIMLPWSMVKELAIFHFVTRNDVEFVYCNDDQIWTDAGETWKAIDDAWAGAIEKYGDEIARKFVDSHITVIKRWRGQKAPNNQHQATGRF